MVVVVWVHVWVMALMAINDKKRHLLRVAPSPQLAPSAPVFVLAPIKKCDKLTPETNTKRCSQANLTVGFSALFCLPLGSVLSPHVSLSAPPLRRPHLSLPMSHVSLSPHHAHRAARNESTVSAVVFSHPLCVPLPQQHRPSYIAWSCALTDDVVGARNVLSTSNCQA